MEITIDKPSYASFFGLHFHFQPHDDPSRSVLVSASLGEDARTTEVAMFLSREDLVLLKDKITLALSQQPATHCGRCHTCGTALVTCLDGEEWCPKCKAYRRYRSHGWERNGADTTPCLSPQGPDPNEPAGEAIYRLYDQLELPSSDNESYNGETPLGIELDGGVEANDGN